MGATREQKITVAKAILLCRQTQEVAERIVAEATRESLPHLRADVAELARMAGRAAAGWEDWMRAQVVAEAHQALLEERGKVGKGA